MFLALLAKANVLCVSSKHIADGDIFTIITVLQLPSKES